MKEMEMPTPCPVCGDVVELNDMYSYSAGGQCVCKECYNDLI